MSLVLRPFTLADYPAIARVHNANWPDNPMLPQTMQSNDQRLESGLVLRRFIAEQKGEVLGSGLFFHMEWLYHPQKFSVGISVHAEHQGQGIGTALHQHLMDELGALDPAKLLASTREDKPAALKFAAKHGFHEEFRAWESKLNLRTFEAECWAKHIERVLAQGYQIKSFAELADDPERERKMYELDLEGGRDVPLPPGETFTFPEQERYWENTYQNPDFQPQLWFLAVKEGEYVGVSMLYNRPVDNDLNTGFTTVKAAHRRRGVALVLKLTALAHAKRLGKNAVRTENAQINRPMLSINEMLGFEKMSAWIDLAKTIKADG